MRTLYDPTGSWTYGRFEVKAKLAKGKHLWPAIWMLPSDYDYGAWPSSGEIDILEARGQETDTTSSAMHFGPAWPNNQYITTGKVKFPGVDFSADYHVFAVEWEENQMTYYVDNNVTWTVDLNKMWYSGTKPYTQKGQPWNKRFHMILNLAIGGSFFDSSYGTLSKTDAQKWQSPSMYVDYVRVYQKSTAVCGDNECTEDETPTSCPADCKSTTTDTTDATTDDTDPSTTSESIPTTPIEPSSTTSGNNNNNGGGDSNGCNCCCSSGTTNTAPSSGNSGIGNQADNNGAESVQSSTGTALNSELENEVAGHKHAIQALAILEAVIGVAMIAGVVALVIVVKKMRMLQAGQSDAPDNNMSLHMR